MARLRLARRDAHDAARTSSSPRSPVACCRRSPRRRRCDCPPRGSRGSSRSRSARCSAPCSSSCCRTRSKRARRSRVMVTVLIGLLAFFLLEKLVLWRHAHGHDAAFRRRAKRRSTSTRCTRARADGGRSGPDDPDRQQRAQFLRRHRHRGGVPRRRRARRRDDARDRRACGAAAGGRLRRAACTPASRARTRVRLQHRGRRRDARRRARRLRRTRRHAAGAAHRARDRVGQPALCRGGRSHSEPASTPGAARDREADAVDRARHRDHRVAHTCCSSRANIADAARIAAAFPRPLPDPAHDDSAIPTRSNPGWSSRASGSRRMQAWLGWWYARIDLTTTSVGSTRSVPVDPRPFRSAGAHRAARVIQAALSRSRGRVAAKRCRRLARTMPQVERETCRRSPLRGRPSGASSRTSRGCKQAYLLYGEYLWQLAAQAQLPPAEKRAPRVLDRASSSTRLRPTNFPATNPEVLEARARDRRREHARRVSRTCRATCSNGRISMTRRERVRNRPQPRRDARQRRVPQRADPADPVRADDAARSRAAAGDRAAVHQQVLHPRSAAGKLVRAPRGRRRATRCSWFRGATSRPSSATSPGTTTSSRACSRRSTWRARSPAARPSMRSASASAERCSRARSPCCRAQRRQRRERDVPDHDARLRRPGRDRRLHRRAKRSPRASAR